MKKKKEEESEEAKNFRDLAKKLVSVPKKEIDKQLKKKKKPKTA